MSGHVKLPAFPLSLSMLGIVVFRLLPASTMEEWEQPRHYISQEAKESVLQLSLQI